MTLKFDPGRQYYFSTPATEFEDKEMPEDLVNVVRRKKFLECQTLDLMKMNQKLKDAHNEVIAMSDTSIQELINAVRSKIHPLFKISESIALLDMLAGMAQLVTTQDYIKPELTDSTLALQASRHPVLDKLFARQQVPTKLIPNDVYCTPQTRFQIITGANMSGKSTYIRSIALNALLAQTGCFVPATHASVPIFHQLFALLATDSNVEANVSSFASEMSSVAFILRNIEPRSLVIIDELGRGTSTTDGLAIAIAIAEALIESKAFVWFVTHFHDLPRILAERAGVYNLHLNVDISSTQQETGLERDENTSDREQASQSTITKMKMTYKIASGPLPTSFQYYGLTLARAISIPEDVIDVAEQVSKALHERNETRKSNPRALAVARRRRLMLGLREQLRLAEESGRTGEDLKLWLSKLQEEFIIRLEFIEREANDQNAAEGVTEETSIDEGGTISSKPDNEVNGNSDTGELELASDNTQHETGDFSTSSQGTHLDAQEAIETSSINKSAAFSPVFVKKEHNTSPSLPTPLYSARGTSQPTIPPHHFPSLHSIPSLSPTKPSNSDSESISPPKQQTSPFIPPSALPRMPYRPRSSMTHSTAHSTADIDRELDEIDRETEDVDHEMNEAETSSPCAGNEEEWTSARAVNEMNYKLGTQLEKR
jgi:DNA mismatch repair protein MSH4